MDGWENLLRWIADHKDALGWLFGGGVVTALLTGLYRLVRGFVQARRQRRLRPREGPFVVLPPGSDLLPVLLPDPTDSPLNDHRIPYVERQPGGSVRREMEDLLRERRALLVVGKSGIGKTREAAHLAQMLNREGWTVLYLPPDAYLEPPASLPSGCPARKLLLFIDDLNRRCYAARREVSPRAGESLALPLTEPFQRRLQRTLEVLEALCGGRGELLVLATARSERTPEYEGEPAEWDKLEWDRYPDLWGRFALYEVPEPDSEVAARFLAELGGAAGVRVKEPETLARRNDGTLRNLVENLRMAANPERGLPALTPETFRDTLRGTWEERYQRAVARYPEARYLYWAAALLRRYGFPLVAWTLLSLARALLKAPLERIRGQPQTAPRGRFRSVLDSARALGWRWRSSLRLLPALYYLERYEAIYAPRDGQLEAAGSPEAEEERVVQVLIRLGFRHRMAGPLYNLAGALLWPD
ncbi:MAG: hypothetical protein N3B68_01600, partial [Anaerolineae bacterium]|nr:hypothetical protein [Anaerolineae bacterium]